ncbi:MAG TPA: agmatinase [Methanobacteriaceae archaeon]|nr:agmatinase [Methanobacteriaceae archaeon]
MLFYADKPLKFAFSKDIENTGEILFNNQEKIFGLLGIPFDSTSTYQTGARFGPLLLRESSYNFENYHLYLDKVLKATFYDLGDVQTIPGNFHKTCKQIEFTVNEVIEKGYTPIVMGGDHSISYPVARAVDIHNATVIHFDAHADFRDKYAGEKYSHATVMRRMWELNPQEIIQIGIRSSSSEEVHFVREENITQFTARDVKNDMKNVLKALEGLEGPIYVTVDMDVLDPAYAPRVGTPAPGGLDPMDLETLILQLKNKDIIGFDVVEVSSSSVGDITSINAAKVILDFLFLY